MSLTEQEMRKMTVKDLRVWAQENTALVGVTSMKKDLLVEALMEELGIETEKKKAKLDVKDRQATKNEILRLKEKQQKLLEEKTKNPDQLKNIRRRIRRLKKELRKVS